MSEFQRKVALLAVAIAIPLLLIALVAVGADSSAIRERLGLTPPLDVPYVESRRSTVQAMVEMAGIGPDDYVIDLGSGDGRILLATARERGARGIGVEIDPALVAEASAEAERQGLADRVTFLEQDLFETPLHDASVVTMFLLPEVNLRLRPRLLAELAPGSRVVSNRFHMGDWQADEVRRVAGYPVYAWVVPADVSGRWQVSGGEREIVLELEQQFQQVTGTALVDGVAQGVEPVLRGKSLRFTLDLGDGPVMFDGVVEGEQIVPAGGGQWEARRD